jgi:hypothetical protein
MSKVCLGMSEVCLGMSVVCSSMLKYNRLYLYPKGVLRAKKMDSGGYVEGMSRYVRVMSGYA